MLALFALPDPVYYPLGGMLTLFGIMLKIVWGARADWTTERATMKAEWVAEKADLITRNDAALVRMQASCTLTTDTLRRIHVEELASLNRRIDALATEVKELRAR